MNKVSLSHKSILILVLVFVFPYFSFSEPNSEEEEIKPNFKDLTANSYLQKANNFMDINTDSARYYANRAYYAAELNDELTIAADALKTLGMINYYSGDYEISKILFLRAEDHYEKTASYHEITICYEWLSSIAMATSQTDEAMKYFVKAMELNDSLGVKDYKRKAFLNFGKVYMRQGNFEKALENLKLAEKLEEDQEPGGNTIGLYNCLGIVLFELNQYDDSDKYFNKSMQIAQELDSKRGVLSVLHNTAIIKWENEQYAESLKDFENILEISDGMGDKLGVAMAYTNMGEIFFETSRYDDAIRVYNKGLEISMELNDLYQLKVIYVRLSDIYDSINDKEKAFHFEALQLKITDSIELIHQSDELAHLRDRMEFERLETELDLLEQEKRIKELTNYLMYTLTAGIVLSFFLVMYLLYKKRRRENLLLIKENELVAAKLAESQLKEEKLKQELNYKIRQLSTHALNIMQKNEALRQLQERVVDIDVSPKNTEKFNQIAGIVNNNLSTNKDWENFNSYFEQINPDFFTKLKNIASDLTSNELRFCSLIKQKYNSREITSILNLSPNTIKSTKYRIRKKLPLQSGQKLDDFIRSL